MKDKQLIMSSPIEIDSSRRRFVTGMAAGGALLSLGLGPQISFARQHTERSLPQTLTGTKFDLNIGYQSVNFTGRERIATAVNGSVPSPILRWREGDRVTLRVTNNLAHDSSIHWHGIILPTEMDGVPGLSFDGIKPGETFEYSFDVNQSGTYWYHSHSGFQEQTGMYGAIVIDPKEPDPVAYDRDYVVMLSDWSDETPEAVYAKLKKLSHYYNFRERTAGDLWRDIRNKGVAQTWKERAMWNQMRMSETDISDVTGYTYTFLMNGQTPDDNWLGLFRKGEKVRLRFINSAAMTIFDVRIPGLKMTVVAADGQNIDPVTVDEFRIGVAETYDVIVEPSVESAYTVFAQAIDRTGYARGTLSPNPEWQAEVPAMDPAPVLGHRDMGMGMDHSMHGGQAMAGMAAMDHSQHDMGANKGMDHSQHGMQTVDHGQGSGLGKAGFGSNRPISHVSTEYGPQVDMRADSPMDGLSDPGIGLRDHQRLYGRRVLTYADICNYYPTHDPREPSREIELHLTGNMSRYMWSINGIKFSDADPIQLKYGERVRFILVNDTMMTHPVHLHGMWSELETGDSKYIPRKHTVIVQPGSKISYLVTADARGRWAYHCHLLYHMPGMFREVRVS
ncbi:copper resistance system multicopper oxidase (plasmid) [Maricurvus nonylphenolicus]|jgi:CopA family copper-resistance protein|uniref:copper resistance system multicopper oxidase n=1 Tax=Maricurvus nonylphenolicus TaxID=1008307 RepID=UPI0036F210F2